MFGLFRKRKKEDKVKQELQKKLDEVNKQNEKIVGKGFEVSKIKEEDLDPIPTDRETLGFVAAKFESRGKIDTISTGKNDPGGKSYGTFQLASKTGTLESFIKQSKFKDRFEGVKIASAKFDNIWLQLCKEEPKSFAQDQKDFIIRTHYLPAARHAHKQGFNMRNHALQEAIYSMSVQHGQFRRIINNADSNGDAEHQVNSLYHARTEYVKGLKSLPEVTKNAILSRFKREIKKVLELV
jgi:hypothetical protein